MTRIYFVRHGESESNRITQFAGSLDMPLTERGQQQALLTAEFLSDLPINAVYASDLSRAYETGKAIAAKHNVPIYSDDALREIYAGEWEGKTYATLEKDFSDSYGVWLRQIGMAVCPGGETVAQLQKRVRGCVERIVQLHPNESVCIATHATPIRVMECIWSGTSLELMHTIPWVTNASVTIVEYEGAGQGRCVERDIHEHLGGLYTKLAKNV